MKNQENQSTKNYHIQELTSEQLLEIYRDTAPAHFPADELKPISVIEDLMEKDAYIGLGLFDEADHLMGYALFLTVPGLDVILLDYYAILTSYRDLGLGSVFLQKMRAYFHQFRGILIETEDIDCASNGDELAQRTRRNAFYRKNGAILTDIRCALYDVPFTIFFLETLSGAQTDNPTEQSDMHITCKNTTTQTDLHDTTGNLKEKLDAIYQFMLPQESYTQNVTWR